MFNISEFSKYLKAERKKAKLTLEQLGEKINVSRQTISSWEKGITSPSVHDLLCLCEVFNCDYGYMVGEYSCKRREHTDIHEKTGLTEESIKALEMLSLVEESNYMKIVNSLLSNPLFISSIQTASEYLSFAGDYTNLRKCSREAKKCFNDESFHDFYSEASKIIKNNHGKGYLELNISEICTLYRLSAHEQLRSAFDEVLKGAVKGGTNN